MKATSWVGGDDVQRPPVNEVVWSIALERTSALIGPYLPDVLGQWFTELPQVQQVFPYQMPVEHADLRQGAIPQNPVIELLPMPESARYWLTAPKQPWLVQVQNDYLALNWRAGHSDEPYVRFDAMRERFTSLLAEVEAGLQRREAQLRPVRAEMTYINVIEPNNLWQRVSDLDRVLVIRVPGNQDAERIAVAYSKGLRVNDVWSGRVHLALDTTYNPIKDAPQVGLTITARSGTLKDASVQGGLEFLGAAHDEIERIFLGLITPEARGEWGL